MKRLPTNLDDLMLKLENLLKECKKRITNYLEELRKHRNISKEPYSTIKDNLL